MAGANFFDFSIESCFEYLLGWDHKNSRSHEEGGILGHLHAFYGSAEYMKHGQLHGHFLIWLDGALNPTEVHDKMCTDKVWKEIFSFI